MDETQITKSRAVLVLVRIERRREDDVYDLSEHERAVRGALSYAQASGGFPWSFTVDAALDASAQDDGYGLGSMVADHYNNEPEQGYTPSQFETEVLTEEVSQDGKTIAGTVIDDTKGSYDDAL